MKRTLILITLLLGALAGHAQDRIYLVTDRPAYLAGDLVYCSLFCTDENGRISDFSAVSYLELISADGTAAEAKIGLLEGRGAGAFRLPAQIPTGNYALVAYTARSGAVPEGTRRIAVFNSTSTARVRDGVTLVPESAYQAPATEDLPAEGGLSLSVPGRLHPGQDATLIISGPAQEASLAVSVWHQDQLAPADGKTLSAFLQGRPAAPGPRMGEYEGEIIYATVEGMKKSDDQATAFLSTAGSPSNVYIGRSAEDGRLRFVTDNIYGDRELVCEVSSLLGQECHINLSSPFTHPALEEPLPPLELSAAQRGALVARKAALQASARLDTLDLFLPRRENLLLETAPAIHYHLDDYTRFPTVKEICVEFVPELQFVKRDGRWRIRMVKSDGIESRKFTQDNLLVMMDGVVLTDHGMLEDFDAMLLEDIDIYTDGIAIGGVAFNGVVNFVSKKNYVTALHFPSNVRVVDFKGVSYPLWYPGSVPAADRDMRQLLYWHPAQELKAGETLRIPLHTPAYTGRFKVVAEGWTSDGSPLRAEYSFEVE